MRYLKLVLAALATGALVAGPIPGAVAALQAPPSYQSSEPSKGEMMDEPPSEVRVTFDQPLDESSWMNVLDECGNEIDAGPATVDLNEMTVGIGKTPSGMYEVVYKAVGLAGATGSSGSSFEFMVHNGRPCGGAQDHHQHEKKKKKHQHRNEHEDHDRDDDGDHGGHGDDPMDHSGHSGMTGMPDHSRHDMGSTQGDGHGEGHGDHRPGRDRDPAQGDGTSTLAGGTGDAPVTADAQAVLIGLGLALAVGVLGGWLLRISGNLTRPV